MNADSNNGNTGVGGRDNEGLPPELTSDNEKFCYLARTHNINCTLDEKYGSHTWEIAAERFQQSLPWLAEKIRVPGLLLQRE